MNKTRWIIKPRAVAAMLAMLLFFTTQGAATDTKQAEKRIAACERNGDIRCLELIEKELAREAKTDKSKRPLVARTLFAKEVIKAREQGATPEREPRLYLTGRYTDRAALLIHGFTACPWEMDELGRYLQKKGVNAYAVRLAGHGTRPEDLERTTWRDWYESVNEGLKLAGMLGERVYVIGVSTGGALAVELGANNPQKVSGVIALAPAIYISDPRAYLACIGRFVMRFNVRPLAEKYKPYYYEKRPVAAICQLMKLAAKTRKDAKRLGLPLLVVQSKTDRTVKPKGARLLFESAKSRKKELLWLEKAPHVLTTCENPCRQKVFEKIELFMQ